MPSPLRKDPKAKRLILSESLLERSIPKNGLDNLTGKQLNRLQKIRIFSILTVSIIPEKTPLDHSLMTVFRKRWVQTSLGN